MKFDKFNALLTNHVNEMVKDQTRLYTVMVDKDILWNKYLDSFPEGTNPKFRVNREFECSCCRHFVKSFGNVVAIIDNKISTIWDFETGDSTFQPVINELSNYVKKFIIESVFVTSELKFGTVKSLQKMEDGQVISWDHFHYTLPNKFNNTSHDTDDTLKGHYNSVRDVFKRSLEEINSESLLTVSELISQNSLYKGEEYKHIVDTFKAVHREYHKLNDDSSKELFLWSKSASIHDSISKIKNTVIGTLLIDLTSGVDVDIAVGAYERKTAPTNYKRPKAIFTARMIEDAKKTLEVEGLLNSLDRRYAIIDDITVNNIIFRNRNVVKNLKGDPLSDLMASVGVNTKKFDRVDEISIDKFVKDVLPNSTNLEVLLENKNVSNLVSLIAAKNSESPSLLKWDNRFSWAYNGNIADSMKERVKAAGGKVDGDLRFSIQWNDDGDCPNDFDAHCIQPNGHSKIYFGHKAGHNSLGELDVDIQYPSKSQVAIENITFPSRNRMPEGIYKFLVHNFRHNGGRSGFSAEVEFDGQLFSFECRRDIKQSEIVEVAIVEYSRKNGFQMISSLESKTQSKKVWNLQTNQFHPVSVCMFSPNYWDEQSGIGHRHYFFMLKDCINDTDPNGFFNEFLKESLMKHKRVFEALGGKMKVEHSDNQLSGLGFSSTKRETLTVKVEGGMSRILKVVF